MFSPFIGVMTNVKDGCMGVRLVTVCTVNTAQLVVMCQDKQPLVTADSYSLQSDYM